MIMDGAILARETQAGISENVVNFKALYSHVIIAEESYKVSVNNLLQKVVKRKIKQYG